MGELVNIVWSSHMEVLRDGLWRFFQNKYKTDFGLSLKNKSQDVMVHHLMLSIFCSSVRHSEDMRFEFDLELLKINETDLQLLIEFMYLGKIKVAKERLPILQDVAEALGFGVLVKTIKSFAEKDVTFIDESVSENVVGEKVKKKTPSGTLDKQKQSVTQSSNDLCSDENILHSTDELFLSLDVLVENEDGNVHSNKVEEKAGVESDTSQWESERLKVKRRKFMNSRKAVNRAKKTSRGRLAASKIATRNSGNLDKYNVDKYYDPIRDGLVCRICDKVLKYKSTYIRHLRCHENPELYSRCSYCDYKSDTKNALIQHLAARHKVDLEGRKLEKNIKCSECSYTCVSDFQLKNHMYVKHTVRGNVCNICGYACKSRAVYEIHLKAVHGNNERPFMCETCGFRAKTLGVLRNHLKTHTDKKTCDICGVWLTYHSYKAHMKLHTTNERPFPCHLCNFAARKKYNLKVHLKNVHKLEDDVYINVNNTIGEDEEPVCCESSTVTAVLINEVGEQLIEMSEQAVMEATFHMDVS